MSKTYHRRPEHRARKSDARATRERARILEAFETFAVRIEAPRIPSGVRNLPPLAVR